MPTFLPYLPNIITGVRFILVAPILWSFFSAHYQLGFYLFLIAGISDGIDGRLARYYGWTSQTGAFLDPLADKLLLMSSFLVLGYLSQLPTWLVAIVIIRDTWIMLGALLYRIWIGPIRYEALMVSKINTVLQVCVILLLLFRLSFVQFPMMLLQVASGAMVATSIISVMQYTVIWSQRAWHHVHKR
jgi:cardiolipin synthase